MVTVYREHRRILFFLLGDYLPVHHVRRVGIIRNNSLVGRRARSEVWTPATERVTLYCTWLQGALTTQPHGQVPLVGWVLWISFSALALRVGWRRGIQPIKTRVTQVCFLQQMEEDDQEKPANPLTAINMELIMMLTLLLLPGLPKTAACVVHTCWISDIWRTVATAGWSCQWRWDETETGTRRIWHAVWMSNGQHVLPSAFCCQIF